METNTERSTDRYYRFRCPRGHEFNRVKLPGDRPGIDYNQPPGCCPTCGFATGPEEEGYDGDRYIVDYGPEPEERREVRIPGAAWWFLEGTSPVQEHASNTIPNHHSREPEQDQAYRRLGLQLAEAPSRNVGKGVVIIAQLDARTAEVLRSYCQDNADAYRNGWVDREAWALSEAKGCERVVERIDAAFPEWSAA